MEPSEPFEVDDRGGIPAVPHVQVHRHRPIFGGRARPDVADARTASPRKVSVANSDLMFRQEATLEYTLSGRSEQARAGADRTPGRRTENVPGARIGLMP
ncbi:hypothetical protein GCM10010232_07900 [Streptomyces amakusaensis]